MWGPENQLKEELVVRLIQEAKERADKKEEADEEKKKIDAIVEP